MISELETGFGLNVDYFDTFSVFEALVAGGTFSNTTDACIPDTSCVEGDAAKQSSFMFWDTVHPTSAVHSAYAQAFSAHYAPIPLPAGALLILTAFGGLAAVRRQQNRRN